MLALLFVGVAVAAIIAGTSYQRYQIAIRISYGLFDLTCIVQLVVGTYYGFKLMRKATELNLPFVKSQTRFLLIGVSFGLIIPAIIGMTVVIIFLNGMCLIPFAKTASLRDFVPEEIDNHEVAWLVVFAGGRLISNLFGIFVALYNYRATRNKDKSSTTGTRFTQTSIMDGEASLQVHSRT